MRLIVGVQPSLGSLPNPVLVIGTLDGVHLGHQSVLRRARALADAQNGTLVVMSFYPHPLKIVDPSRAPIMMQTFGQRCATLQALGVEVLWVIPFSREFAELPHQRFAELFLHQYLPVRYICVGHNFHFGHGRKGHIAYLQRLGLEWNFQVEEVAEFRFHNFPLRSTAIRRFLLQGRIHLASRLLGRPYTLAGTIEHGQHLGTQLGFPTANLKVWNELVPKRGVYLTHLQHRGRGYPGLTNIGLRPTLQTGLTFQEEKTTIETHLLDYSGNLYGEFAELQFLARLRNEKKFDSLELLQEQLRRDRTRAIRFFQNKYLSSNRGSQS